MMKMRFPLMAAVTGVLLGSTGSALWFHHCFRPENSGKIHTRQFPVMGTLGRITIYGMEAQKASEAMEEAQKVFYHVQKLCSVFDRESPLSRINESAAEKPVTCPEELFTLLEECSAGYILSGGAFDAAIRPLMLLWGFYRKRNTLPSEKELEKTLAVTGWNKVVLDRKARTVFFRKKGISLDLGGVAKGYALDQAAAVLQKTGVKKFVLDLGGNLLCRNENESDAPFRIGIRSPEKPGKISETIFLRNGAVATSGSYERYVIIGGKRYSHIMDPRTGKPVEETRSVTVMTRRGIDSDIFSTAIFVLGKVPPGLPPGTKVWFTGGTVERGRVKHRRTGGTVEWL